MEQQQQQQQPTALEIVPMQRFEGVPVDRGALRMKLAHWASEVYEIGGLDVLELRHRGTRAAVARFAYKVDAPNALDKLTTHIANMVEHDVRNLRRRVEQEYVVEAFYGGQGQPTGFHRMTVRLDESADGLDRYDEDAGDFGDGLKGKDREREYKHILSALTKVFKFEKNGNLRLTARYQESIEKLLDRIDILIDKRDADRDKLETALDRQEQRKMEAERSREVTKALRELFDTAKVMMPILVNFWAKEQVLPVPDYAHPVVEQMRQLYEAITRDESVMAKIMDALGQSKPALVAFSGLMSSIEDFRDVAKAKAKHAAETEAKVQENAKKEAEEQATANDPKAAAPNAPPRKSYAGPFGPSYGFGYSVGR